MRPADREILRLAVPAFAALVAEPLFLLTDSAIVGHLGTPQLAGLGIAGAVLTTLVSLCIFLAYGTTAAVARRFGAGDLRSALAAGIDGLWLAGGLGIILGLAGLVVAEPVLAAFGANDATTAYGLTYLRISLLGVPAMLLVLAATGILRGLQDTRTPLVVAVSGALANVVLNVVLVYGVGLGIAGSAWGTVVAQAGMAAAFLVIVVRAARRSAASLRPDVRGIRAAGSAAVPLLVRTATLRVALLLTTYVAASTGTESMAAHQVAFNVWMLLALALDAIAIAGQAIVGKALGASDVALARDLTRRMLWWGGWIGVVLGALVVVARPAYVPLFTPDEGVRSVLAAILVVAAVFQPVAGVVFALDGVLIGAGDARYLAWAGVATLVAFAPLALLVHATDAGIEALWWAFNGFLLARLVTLVWRWRGDAWLVTGAAVPAGRRP